MTEDNDDLFRQSIGNIKPLKKQTDTLTHQTSKKAAVPRQFIADEQKVMDDLLSDDLLPEDLETGESLYFAQTGLQHKVLRKLKRGQYRIEDELDLHGYTRPEARKVLIAFLQHSKQQSFQCVRIIHGKGRRTYDAAPVLKAAVNKWLRQRNEVLAFSSARPEHGGTGALYVLLKKAA